MNRVLILLLAMLSPIATMGAAPDTEQLVTPERGAIPQVASQIVQISSQSSRPNPKNKAKKPYETGTASWYGPHFHGKKTANGETFDMYGLTAAHRSLPLGTWVRVTNLRNGASVLVRVNDRGPVPESRIIDLSYEAATLLDVRENGIAKVRIDLADPVTIATALHVDNLN